MNKILLLCVFSASMHATYMPKSQNAQAVARLMDYMGGLPQSVTPLIGVTFVGTACGFASAGLLYKAFTPCPQQSLSEKPFYKKYALNIVQGVTGAVGLTASLLLICKSNALVQYMNK